MNGPIEGSEICAFAWHDVNCPEGRECRSRRLHALSDPLHISGRLNQFQELTWDIALEFARYQAARARKDSRE